MWVQQHIGNWSTVLSTNVTVDVVITGQRTDGTTEVVEDTRRQLLHVYCPNASAWCHATTLNHINALRSPVYTVRVAVVGRGARANETANATAAHETRVPWMGDALVHMQSAHVSYTFASVVMAPAVAVLLAAAGAVFAATAVRRHGLSLHYRWVLLLLGAGVLFNTPLEVLSVLVPGWPFALLEEVCVALFVVLLCGFWLALFRVANAPATRTRFFEGRSAREAAATVAAHAVPVVLLAATATWQRLHDRDAFDLLGFFGYEVLSALLIVVCCFYTAVALYALCRAGAEFDPARATEGTHRRHMLFYGVSFAVLLATVLFWIIKTLVPSFLDHLGRDVFLCTLLDGYLLVLLVFSLPHRRFHYKVSTQGNFVAITEVPDDESIGRASLDTASSASSASGAAPHSSFSMDFQFSSANDVPDPADSSHLPREPATSASDVPPPRPSTDSASLDSTADHEHDQAAEALVADIEARV